MSKVVELLKKAARIGAVPLVVGTSNGEYIPSQTNNSIADTNISCPILVYNTTPESSQQSGLIEVPFDKLSGVMKNPQACGIDPNADTLYIIGIPGSNLKINGPAQPMQVTDPITGNKVDGYVETFSLTDNGTTITVQVKTLQPTKEADPTSDTEEFSKALDYNFSARITGPNSLLMINDQVAGFDAFESVPAQNNRTPRRLTIIKGSQAIIF